MSAGRLLWILPYMPWPSTSGGKLRQAQLLRELSRRGYRISLLIQSKTPPAASDLAVLQSWTEQIWVYPRRPLRSSRTLLAAVAAATPLLASINGYNPALSHKLAELLRQPWDVVQLEHSYSLQPYLKVLQDYAPGFVLTEHNLESSLSQATYQRLPALLRPLAAWDRWRYRRWERQALSQAREVIALTPADAASFRQLTPSPVRIVPNGADVDAGAAVRPDHHAQTLLFLGNYEYSPNVEAIRYLAEEIMPAIWAVRPQARLAVAGFAMHSEWPSRWPDQRIQWHGYVENIQPLQGASTLFIAPLQDGGGSKLKVLEALAAGLPLVSTAQGASGLQLRDGEDCLLADDADGLAGAAIRLLDDAALAARLGKAGREYVWQHHSWQHVCDLLEQIYHGDGT
ncbi:glycosyltransferase family 4 protein [Frateuria aurantia]